MSLRLSRFFLVILVAFSTAGWAMGAPVEKWIYSPTNLQVDANVEKLQTLWTRAAKAGYTHVLLTDTKLAKLGDLGSMTKPYFRNLERIKTIAAELKLELVPAVFHVGYSNDTLWHDPNLIEAMPVKEVPLIVGADGAAHLAPNAAGPSLRGGDFSDLKKWSWVDPNVALEDGAAKITDPQGGNARISAKLKVEPFRQYHVSVRIKTQEFKGKPEIKPMGAGGVVLSWDDLQVKPTQDWTTHHAVFNSQNNTEVQLYFGVWGGKTGSLWWDDAAIEEVAFVNLVRRPGAPLQITREEGAALTEGSDFEKFADPRMGRDPWPGSYDVYHEPPVLKTKLPAGTKLRASYYHGVTIYQGQAMICPSEPKTMELLRDNARRVHAAFGAKGYMMSHDEIRVLNWCAACQKRHLTPGQILADNVQQCVAMLEEINPGGKIYVWSDMFDPNHNAVKGPYYLVNGDLRGSWEGLPKEVIVMPWYFSKRAESLGFFAGRGHQQVIAGYYDDKPERVADWLDAADKVPASVIGVMYTTWRNKYDDLEKFAGVIDAHAPAK
jgi:hypothetical protein